MPTSSVRFDAQGPQGRASCGRRFRRRVAFGQRRHRHPCAGAPRLGEARARRAPARRCGDAGRTRCRHQAAAELRRNAARVAPAKLQPDARRRCRNGLGRRVDRAVQDRRQRRCAARRLAGRRHANSDDLTIARPRAVALRSRQPRRRDRKPVTALALVALLGLERFVVADKGAGRITATARGTFDGEIDRRWPAGRRQASMHRPRGRCVWPAAVARPRTWSVKIAPRRISGSPRSAGQSSGIDPGRGVGASCARRRRRQPERSHRHRSAAPTSAAGSPSASPIRSISVASCRSVLCICRRRLPR